jgi:hypothetical protein
MRGRFELGREQSVERRAHSDSIGT